TARTQRASASTATASAMTREFGEDNAAASTQTTLAAKAVADHKANLEKLASGDVIKVAEVVRDLWRRERERGLSAGEKRMLAKARQILVSELALAEKTNEDKAEAILDEVLAS
ncbi:MAG: hypothetical protein VW239_09630, partial [Candidatus Nanopelagicales bacterium]